MLVSEVTLFHQCNSIHLKKKKPTLKNREGLSCKEKLGNTITEHHAQERNCSENLVTVQPLSPHAAGLRAGIAASIPSLPRRVPAAFQRKELSDTAT